MMRATNLLTGIERLALGIGAGFSLFCLAYASNPPFQLNGFYIWVVVPFLVYFGWSAFLCGRRHGPIMAPCSCAVAILMLAFTLIVYIGGVFISVSSTSGLIFIFAPLYLLLGGPLLLGICFLVAVVVTSRKGN